MMFSPVRILSVFLFSLTCAVCGFAKEPPPIVAKARAYLGTDAALNAVKSVHYMGTLVTANSASASGTTAMIEIIFQKPYQQRITATSEQSVPATKAGESSTIARTIEVTALDDYDAWRRVQDAKDPARWQITLLDKDQIKRLRANTWENLSYYSGLDRGGVRVESRGPASVGSPVRAGFVSTSIQQLPRGPAPFRGTPIRCPILRPIRRTTTMPTTHNPSPAIAGTPRWRTTCIPGKSGAALTRT